MTSKLKHNNPLINYKDAGVDVEAGYELVERIKPYVEKTKRPEILSGLGSFSALSRIPKHIENPLLVTCTDGVGTKIEIARNMNQFQTIGIDLVAMCVNDLIACGAEPLLFLDYYVTDQLKVCSISSLVTPFDSIHEYKFLAGQSSKLKSITTLLDSLSILGIFS